LRGLVVGRGDWGVLREGVDEDAFILNIWEAFAYTTTSYFAVWGLPLTALNIFGL